MQKLGRKIVKFRIPIFILSLLLLIPAGIGYINTRVNYDVLYYLPDEIETMKGQDILVDEFGTGAYSMFICEGMPNKDVAALKKISDEAYSTPEVVLTAPHNGPISALENDHIETVDQLAVTWRSYLKQHGRP